MGEESKIPSVITLGTQMAKKALKTPDNNCGMRRSTRMRYHVQRLTYGGFVAHHYTYMVRVIQEVEPTCFEQEVGNMKWDNAMCEEFLHTFTIKICIHKKKKWNYYVVVV